MSHDVFSAWKPGSFAGASFVSSERETPSAKSAGSASLRLKAQETQRDNDAAIDRTGAGAVAEFVFGEENRLAAAALALFGVSIDRLLLADDPADGAVMRTPAADDSFPQPLLAECNPLLLYGPTGVGKTHLALGLAETWKQQNPRRKAIVTTGADFARSYAAAVQADALAQWRTRIRSCRLLVIDDLEEMAGKTAAQEELQFTIDALLETDRRQPDRQEDAAPTDHDEEPIAGGAGSQAGIQRADTQQADTQQTDSQQQADSQAEIDEEDSRALDEANAVGKFAGEPFTGKALVVVTLRSSPLDARSLAPPLVGRLSSGLSIPLAAPGLETRRRMTRLLAETWGIGLTGGAADRLAEQLPVTHGALAGTLQRIHHAVLAAAEREQALTDSEMADSEVAASGAGGRVSERVGAVALADALARFQGLPCIDEALVSKHLHQQAALRKPTLRSITAAVCRRYHVKTSDLKGAGRRQSLVMARSMAMYLARRLTGASLEDVGAHFGGRDHTTVMHACRKMALLVDADPDVRRSFLVLCHELEAAPGLERAVG